MKLGYFPGCSLLGSSREYNESLQAIAPRLGIELVEIPDWNCCGATAAHSMSHRLALALPARILALAEKAGLTELAVPCSACYSRLLATHQELTENPGLCSEVNTVIEMEYRGTVNILNVLDVLTKAFANGSSPEVSQPFNHKVACYYGCYLVRPPKAVKADHPEDPQAMDQIMKKIGADPLDWAFKVECCGAGFSVSRTDVVARLSGKILEDAAKRGAEAIIVACPMCHSNLDLRRDAIAKGTGVKSDIPALYITQAIGLALGLDRKSLGLHRHIVPVCLKQKEPQAAA